MNYADCVKRKSPFDDKPITPDHLLNLQKLHITLILLLALQLLIFTASHHELSSADEMSRNNPVLRTEALGEYRSFDLLNNDLAVYEN